MTNEEMKELTERLQEKLGKEASGLIADDIGLLISDTSKMNSDINSRNEEIQKLKEQKKTKNNIFLLDKLFFLAVW